MPDVTVGAIRNALRRLRGSVRTSRFERELADELRLHIEFEADALVARGMNPVEAMAEARRRFGSVAFAKDACRDSWGLHLIDALVQDGRYAARMIAKHPAFSIVVVVTLALGIGANTAIFSVVHAVLLRSLPYTAGDRLIEIRQQLSAKSVENIGLSARDLDDYRTQATTLDGIVEYHQMSFTLLDKAQPSRVVTGVVSSGFFDLLGVEPILGRTFHAEDERHDAPAVLVLSYPYWQHAFSGDPHIVGRTFQMNDRVHTVIGVLPPVPQYPADNDVYMPVSACPFRSAPAMATDRTMRMVSAIARLKPGVALERTRAELTTIGQRLSATYPDAYDSAAGFSVAAVSVRDQLTARARPLLLLLLAATAFVLVLVCANVANLMIARLAGRDRELSLRAALGAGRARLARQLLTESTMLALAGGSVGLILAVFTRDLLVAFTSRLTLRAAEISIDRPVLLFAFAVSVATGLVFGVVPVVSLAPIPGAAVSRRRIRQGLIAAQVAISFVLLIGAGLMVRSFVKLRAVDAGFDAERVLTAVVDLDWVKYDTGAERRNYFRTLLERLGRQPDVEVAALSLTFPLSGSDPLNVEIVTDAGAPKSPAPLADFRLASPSYFRAIGMTLLSGRGFSASDADGTRPVAIVNLSMARHYFGVANPVGRRISLDHGHTWCRVVGVVNDVRQYGLASLPADEVYVPFDQRAPLSATLLVRTKGDAMAIWRDVQRIAYGIDERQPVSRPLTLEQARTTSIAPPRLTAALASLFAILALLVTATGIAGVISFFVAQRRVEIGVRRALGAPQRAVVQLVARQVLAPVALGLTFGIAGALAVSRAVAPQLFEVQPTDPATYATVALALAAVAVVACAAPARRAAAIQPATTLRMD